MLGINALHSEGDFKYGSTTEGLFFQVLRMECNDTCSPCALASFFPVQMFGLMYVHNWGLSDFCFCMSMQLHSLRCFYFAGSQSSLFTPVPALPILESVCLRALHDEHEKLDVNAETSAITSEISDKENAELGSQRTEEEEVLEPAKKKLKGG